MKYCVKFDSIEDASNYYINNVPFACSINAPRKQDIQNLHCKQKNKIIKNIDNVSYIIDSYKGLAFKSNGQTTISLQNNGNNMPDMKYSFDNGDTWTQWDYSTISLNDKVIICFKGNNPNGFSTSSSKYSKFVFGGSGTIEAHGNIMSLIDDGACNTLTIPYDYCFISLFNGCTSLTSAPELPATTLVDWCYYCMFWNCTSLTSAPELPATALVDWCYYCMFWNCTSLTSAPELPATALVSYCYSNMFNGCTSLTSAPELPATTLASGCYLSMFYGCTNLNHIKCLATSGINTNNSTNNWVYNVKSIGTFVKASSASWPTGNNGIPSGWTVQTA